MRGRHGAPLQPAQHVAAVVYRALRVGRETGDRQPLEPTARHAGGRRSNAG